MTDDLKNAIEELIEIVNHPINVTYGYDIHSIIDELSVEHDVDQQDLIDAYDNL